ncbi:MAG: ABC transporter ATP-binding protein [Chloroflexota bacterium]|nr:ABC transporter ATP-binding protein [Chloroflexota bacterium]
MVEVRDLRKLYRIGHAFSRDHVHAVDGVSFSIASGETLALVGESGSGKSTVARTVLRLEAPTAGETILDGTSVTRASEHDLRRMRARMQMVFQDPYDALNPRMRIGEQVAEPLWLSGTSSRRDALQQAREFLRGLHLPADVDRRYPHQLSGGQLQRVGIARALVTEPSLVILDEPTSALDVSVQAQIINLLVDLQAQRSLAYLFISHDLHVVGYLADRVAVMYLGQIIELGPTASIFERPGHPYTRALISAAPVDHPRDRRQRVMLSGEPTSPINPKPGCRLATRCPFALPMCVERDIDLTEVLPGHSVRCRRFAEEHQDGVWTPAPTGWKPGFDPAGGVPAISTVARRTAFGRRDPRVADAGSPLGARS